MSTIITDENEPRRWWLEMEVGGKLVIRLSPDESFSYKVWIAVRVARHVEKCSATNVLLRLEEIQSNDNIPSAIILLILRIFQLSPAI